MEIVFDLLKITLPAAVVLYGMFLVVKSFVRKETEQRLLAIRESNAGEALPIRLQAYERVALLVERCSPENLVVRLNEAGISARQLHAEALGAIREEYNYNLSQQVYVSEELWTLVGRAREQVVTMFNAAAEGLEDEATGVDLARRLFALVESEEENYATVALNFLRQEVQTLF